MKKKLMMSIWSLVALLFFTCSGFAQIKASHDKNFFELGGGVLLFNPPNVIGSASRIDDAGFNFIRQAHDPFDLDSTDAIGSVRMGHKVGSRTWIEGSFQMAKPQSDTRISQTLGAGEFFDILRINGGGGIPAGFANPGERVDSTIDSSFRYYDFGLLVRREYNLPFDGLQIIPLIGLNYVYIDQDLKISDNILLGTHLLHEQVKTDFFGIVLGSELNHQLSSRTRVYGDVRAAVVFSDAKFRGDQSILGVAGTPTENTDTRTGFRGGAMIGAEIRLGSVILGLEARVEHWTHVPQIVNPTSSTFSSARLESSSMTNESIMATVTVPFGK